VIHDLNKTDLTKAVTQLALVYFDERGCKPIETEVTVAKGWIADLAGVLNPTVTELQLLKLLRRKPKGYDTHYTQWRIEAKNAQRLLTVIVEVKTSRSDFRGDRKWTALAPPANLCYLAIPEGDGTHDNPCHFGLRLDEFPIGWGLLSCAPKRVRCLRVPAIREVTAEQQLNVVLQIAVRRDNNTRYERLRELQRAIRAAKNGEISRMRTLYAMKAMKSIVEGEHGSVKEALEYHGVRHMPEYYMAELEKLWAIMPTTQSKTA
jgi:hypothetical protein